MAVTIKGFASDWSVPDGAKTKLDDIYAHKGAAGAAVLESLRPAARVGEIAANDRARRFKDGTATWSDPDFWRARAVTKHGRRVVGVKHDDANGLIIGYSDDDAATWTQAHQFPPAEGGRSEALIVTSDGEVLVAVRTNSGAYDAKLYKSTGFDADPATATWALVFDTPWAEAATTPHGLYRGLTHDGKNAVAGAWYDKKTVSGATVYGNDAGVRVRASYDNGVTWVDKFNLRTWLLGRGLNPDVDGYHVHSITYDHYTNGWLVSYGDTNGGAGECGILHFSHDFATITTLYTGTGPWQAVSLYSLADCVLALGDGGTSGGVNRIPRNTDGSFGAIEKAYALDNSIGTSGYQNAPGDVTILPLSQISGATPLSRLLVTGDGYTMHELYLDTTYAVSGVNGFQFVVGPTSSGKIIATSINDGRYAGHASQLTVTLP